MTTNKNYYTVKELADTIGLSRIAVFNRIKNGKIKAEKIGRNYIIYKKDLDGALNGNLTADDKISIERGVKRVLGEYGDVIRMLGKE